MICLRSLENRSLLGELALHVSADVPNSFVDDDTRPQGRAQITAVLAWRATPMTRLKAVLKALSDS